MLSRALIPVIAALLAPSPTLAANHSAYVCTTSEKYVCSMGTGCLVGVPGSWANVDVVAGTYDRCDSKGPCDSYRATFTPSGQVLNVEVPGKGAFLKMLPGGSFSEVASQGTILIVSYGYCGPKD